MSQQPNNADQEIDLAQITNKVKNLFSGIGDSFFNFLIFIKKNILIIIGLAVVGAVSGFFLDKEHKVYNHELIVIPNFGSSDYLYSKIDLLNSKIKENDEESLKQLGIKNPDNLLKVTIEPLNDIYQLVNNKEKNFELLKLMAEDGDINEVLQNKATSKNYTYHLILFKTDGRTNEKDMIRPVIDYLNDNTYYNTLKQEYLKNLDIKIKANETIISQIDGVLNNFSNSLASGSSNNKLIYYNENTQLNDIIKTKDQIIEQQAQLRIAAINFTKVIKDNSINLNILDNKSVNGKFKIILPISLILLYMLIILLRNFYRKQLTRRA